MNKRLSSLDAFRGLTIVGMILVNNPGSWRHVYAPLQHAEWHGWTPTDLVFPFFLFIVGVSISFSLSKRMEQGTVAHSLYFKIMKRTLIRIFPSISSSLGRKSQRLFNLSHHSSLDLVGNHASPV